jgi:molybdopterin/thiamine biosynthesis adenylyltransferase
MNRYDRQISVAEFGVDGQKKLAAAKILVVGAGGLASPVLQYLAGAGLGHIKVMDYDIVSVNNMHRQTIFRADDLGLAKAGAAATNMRRLNPDCQMTPIIEPLTPDNIETHASDVDLVLDCADSFAVSYSPIRLLFEPVAIDPCVGCWNGRLCWRVLL